MTIFDVGLASYLREEPPSDTMQGWDYRTSRLGNLLSAGMGNSLAFYKIVLVAILVVVCVSLI